MQEENLERRELETNTGTIVYFCRIVNKDAPTVLLLHGLSANHTTWTHTMEVLAAQGWNSIAPDLRGHGYSDKRKRRSQYRLPINVTDMCVLLDQEDLQTVHVVGYSYGGAIALELARTRLERVATLVLVSTNHTNPLRYTPFWFMAPVTYLAINMFGYLLIWQGLRHYHYFVQGRSTGYWQSTFRCFSTMPMAINMWMLSELARFDRRGRLDTIRCPTLVVYSVGDQFVSEKEVADMVAAFPNGSLHQVEEKTHFLASRHQDELAKIMIAFLKDHENSHIQ